MTKPPIKQRRSRYPKKIQKQKISASVNTKKIKKIIIFAVITILAAIPFSLGKYFEFNQPGPYDSASNVYSAKVVLDGEKIGIDHFVSAATGTLLINMLGVWTFGFSEFGPKLIQAILQAASMIIMFIAIRKLAGNLPAAIAVIIASVYLSSPLIAKFGNVKEQFMIAFMIMGISLFIMRQLNGKWWLALLSGMMLSWGPLFKETGCSAIAGVALFLIVQPIFKHRTWKQTITDIALLFAGAAITLIPVYLWLFIGDIKKTTPYDSIWKTALNILTLNGSSSVTIKTSSRYVEESRETFGLAKQFPIVMRYYKLLILPIAMSLASIIAGFLKTIFRFFGKSKNSVIAYDRFVLLLAVWWILDMAFVWISPRSYEQYYLPLNASAAMLGAYIVTLYRDAFLNAENKPKWFVLNLCVIISMITMSWHIFFGIQKSPHSGFDYGKRKRGYAQKLQETSNRIQNNLKGHWEIVGQYIRDNSTSEDKIYVWGWYPGIYIKAQRLSPAPKAFEGNMHTMSPDTLDQLINEIITAFKKQPPEFIVDSRKRHFPWDRPPLELWPQNSNGFIPYSPQYIQSFDNMYANMLKDKISEDEAQRYIVMKSFREFVMKNYNIVNYNFGPHVLFKHK